MADRSLLENDGDSDSGEACEGEIGQSETAVQTSNPTNVLQTIPTGTSGTQLSSRHPTDIVDSNIRQQQVQETRNAYDITGGEFGGASFGPQTFHMTRQAGVIGGNFEGAHIGPRTIQNVIHYNYFSQTEDDSPGPSNLPKRRKVESQTGIIHLNDTIKLCKIKPLSKQGHVFEGKQTSEVYGTRPVAIKFLPHSEKTIREAKTLLKLANHSNVVSLIHADVYQSYPFPNIFIAMELCHTQNLHEFIIEKSENEGDFDLDQAIRWAQQLVRGIDFIHENNVIHRDFKPHNVLLSVDRKHLKIADFGLSKEMTSGRSVTDQSTKRVGTDGYRAPETYNSDVISKQADIYSLGLVIYFIWSDGKHAFGNDPDDWNSNIKRNINRDLSYLLVGNIGSARELLDSMLNFDPRLRPNTSEISEHAFFHSAVTVPKQGRQNISTDNSGGATCQSTPVTANAIVIFDKKSKALHSYQPDTKSWRKMQNLHEVMAIKNLFSAVVLDGRIHVLMSEKAMYTLNYSDERANWTKGVDMNENHGWHPPGTVYSGSIWVVGASGGFGVANTTLEKYIPSRNCWISCSKMTKMKRNHSIVCVRGFIYCIGGWDDRYHPVASVERFDTRTETWLDLAPLPHATRSAAAIAVDDTIFVMGGHDGENLTDVKCYDIINDTWTVGAPMLIPRCHFCAFVVQGSIFAIGGDENRTIERFDFSKNEWTEEASMMGMKIYRMASVVVEMDSVPLYESAK